MVKVWRVDSRGWILAVGFSRLEVAVSCSYTMNSACNAGYGRPDELATSLIGYQNKRERAAQGRSDGRSKGRDDMWKAKDARGTTEDKVTATASSQGDWREPVNERRYPGRPNRGGGRVVYEKTGHGGDGRGYSRVIRPHFNLRPSSPALSFPVTSPASALTVRTVYDLPPHRRQQRQTVNTTSESRHTHSTLERLDHIA
ncbi:hypothetical protein BC629DRAFT_929777 [Irpex lacteus]|nr:hypothetical protein BC629DRAFT_929777 [Irpex lacteus]